jgi:ADP-ribosylglycohydrolase
MRKRIHIMFMPLKDIREICASRISMLDKQGHDITGLLDALNATPESYDALLGFAREINHVPLRKDFPYVEPNDLESIRRLRPADRHDVLGSYISEMEIRDKIYGGVYGRIAGCVLGKPLEVSWDLPRIRQYLEGAGAWPLDDYVPAHSPSQPGPLRRDCIDSMKGFVTCAQEDDDINYLVLGLVVQEWFGPGFTTQNMAYVWHKNIPYGWTWGPEHSRYYLLAGLWVTNKDQMPRGAEWDELESFLNDGEELIGAMIRGDAFGLVNPGRTETAAEMAWRDGRLTHGKTGLYAEMWVAATIAAAFHERGPEKAIRAGIDQLPANSRYAECCRQALDIALNEPDWLKAWEPINARWGHLGHAGTMNETAAIINALIHSVDATGNVDFEKAICTTVMQGWDTDCAGATAGCIAGVLAGRNAIPDKWTAPLNDTFHTCVATMRETRISGLAERMYQMSRIVRAAEGLKAV